MDRNGKAMYERLEFPQFYPQAADFMGIIINNLKKVINIKKFHNIEPPENGLQ